MSNPEAEKLSVITNLRACLISAQDGVPVQNINRDYRDLIGENVPYQRLGYKSIEDFLRTLPDITVQCRNGTYYVQASANENTASLISLVKGQKRSVPRRKLKQNRNTVHLKQTKQPRFRRRPMAPATSQWPTMKTNANLTINTSANGSVRAVSFKQDGGYYPCVDENKNVKIDKTPIKKSPPQPQPLLEKKIAPPENKAVPLKHSVSLDATPAPPSSKLSSRLQKNKSSPDIQKTPEVSPESKLNARLKQATQSNNIKNLQIQNETPTSKSVTFSTPITPTKISPPAPVVTSPRQSAQSRLEKTRIPSLESKLVVVVDTQEGNKTCFHQSKLSSYVQEHKWKEPSYVVYKQKSGKRHQTICFACTVRVAIPRQSFRLPEEIFECSTFPIDFLDQAESKEHAAYLALEKLKEREDLMNAPIENDPTVIIQRIKKFLENKDCGIWAQKIEDEYKIAHKQLLPTYWVDIVKVSEQIEVEELGPSFIIRIRGESVSPSRLSTTSMPELTYPSGNTWDVFITAGTTVTKVFLRFIGDEYSSRFDLLTSSMDTFYENTVNHIHPKFAVGEYCAAYYIKSWWRVIITDLEGDFMKIKFIDHGDEEKLHRSNLFRLDSQFFRLPPQAVSVSLKGLEEFDGRREAEDFFNKTIIGKSLVGVIEPNQTTTISLTLYDTSDEEAVNLNESLRHLFELNYKIPPRLELGFVYEMTVTNIEADGTVYVQIYNDGLALLQELIDFFEEIEFESVKDYNQVKEDKIYLAFNQDDNLFYRVKPVIGVPVDSKVQCFCIDYGKYCSVFLEDLVNMEEDSSYLLDKVPGQAIRVTLHDIPPAVFTPSIKKRLQNLVSGDISPVIVGRVRDIKDEVPIVELFRRTMPDHLLVSINQTLVIEENIDLASLQMDRLSISSGRVSPALLPKSVPVPKPVISPTIKPKKTTELMTKILTAYPIGAIERILSQNRPELPDIDEYFNIYVHSTVSPSHFLINPSDYVNSLNKVMDEMNSYYNNNKVQTILEEGSLCAAKDGAFWYRAYVDKIIDMENVSVKVLDYGCVKIISSSNIKPLLDIFTKHPYIGFTAKIHGIVPVHGDWSVEDSITMKNLINRKTIRAKLKDVLPNKQGLGGMMLSLELLAVDNNGEEFHVAEHFVRQFKAKVE